MKHYQIPSSPQHTQALNKTNSSKCNINPRVLHSPRVVAEVVIIISEEHTCKDDMHNKISRQCPQQCDEIGVVLASNAVIQPLAVMVELFYAFIADPAVLTQVAYGRVADRAYGLTHFAFHGFLRPASGQ